MDGVKVNLRSINTDAIYAMAQEVKMEAPTAEELVLNGMKVEGKQFFLGGLAQATEYTIYVVGVLGDKYGEVQILVCSVVFGVSSVRTSNILNTDGIACQREM